MCRWACLAEHPLPQLHSLLDHLHLGSGALKCLYWRAATGTRIAQIRS